MMKIAVLLFAVMASCLADVSHLSQHLQEPHHEDRYEEPPPPPRPYAFGYTAGRYPGHADRVHQEVSDGSGVVRGTFSYVDPRQKIRTVEYVADQNGFHPVLSHPQPDLPTESEAVAKERQRHLNLYNRIAEQHANNPHPPASPEYMPHDTRAVQEATHRHQALFAQIAEQHAQIAAEREVERRAFEATSEKNDHDTHHDYSSY